jgi:hypothetical protein
LLRLSILCAVAVRRGPPPKKNTAKDFLIEKLA